jgi:hypothetical protein
MSASVPSSFHPHGGAGSIIHGGHSQSANTVFTVADAFKYAVANFVTKATGEAIVLLDKPITLNTVALLAIGVTVTLLFKLAIAIRVLVAIGVTATLLLRLIVAILVLVATGATVVFKDSAQIAVFVTTATGKTLELQERLATPVGLPDLEPKGDSVTLLLRLTTAIFALVATGLTVTLLLKLTTAIFALVATGVTVALLLKLTTAIFALVATGVTVALLLSLTADVYIGVTRVLEDMDTFPITVLAGGLMVTLAEDPADINPALVPEEAPNETPSTPNLGPPRRPAIGIGIF